MVSNAGLGGRLRELFKDRMIERPARGMSVGELAAGLERSGAALEKKLAEAAGKPGNVKQLRHIIAIERWGARRLRVALGEPFVPDGNRDHQPPPDASWDDLRSAFATTRAATVATARELERAGPGDDLRVHHNGLGGLSVRGWLRYLDGHASREGWRIR